MIFDIDMITNIFIHIIILYIFLLCFFFLFASKLSQDTFNHEIGQIIDRNFDSLKNSLDDSQKEIFKTQVNLLPLNKFIKDTSHPDKCIKEHNDWLKTLSVSFIIMIIIILMLIVYIYYSFGVTISLKDLVVENIVTFLFIGIVEYLFFVNVAFKYIPAPPSLLTASFVNKFKSELVSPI